MSTVITRSQRNVLFAVLGLSLLLRLGWVLVVDPLPTLGGGDAQFYLHLSEQLMLGHGLHYHDQPMAVVGPVYPLYLAALRFLAGSLNVVLAARIGQAIIGSLLVGVTFAVGRRWVGTRAGLAAAALLAVDLRFIAEVGSISTETLLASMLVLCLWAYLEAVEKQRVGLWLLTGISLGVATLTRAAVQLLPLVLLLHLWMLFRDRRVWRQGGLIVAGFAFVVCPWVVRNWALFGRPKIVEGGAAHFWMGARGEGRAIGYAQMMEDVETLRIGEGGSDRFDYLGNAIETVTAHPIHYVNVRMKRLLEAYLQPYGTVVVGDVLGSYGLKKALMLTNWHSIRDLVASPAFWPKLWIYLMHYGSIGLALLYIFTRIRKWRQWLLPSLIVGYFSFLYAFLTIIPRYLFPVMPLYILLASALIVDHRHRVADLRVCADTRLSSQRSLDTQLTNT